MVRGLDYRSRGSQDEERRRKRRRRGRGGGEEEEEEEEETHRFHILCLQGQLMVLGSDIVPLLVHHFSQLPHYLTLSV